MSTETLPRPAETGEVDDSWFHLFCPCDPNLSLCGLDISGEEICHTDDEDDDDLCPMCDMMDDGSACPRCGR